MINSPIRSESSAIGLLIKRNRGREAQPWS